MATDEQIVSAAYCALRAFNMSEFIQEYVLSFHAPKSEVDKLFQFITIIRGFKNLKWKT